MSQDLPALGDEMRDLFRSGSAAQFLLHGNIFDVVRPARAAAVAAGVSRRGDVRELRRRAPLRPQPRHPRDARRARTGASGCTSALGPDGATDDAAARAGLGARADRSLPAAHAQPAGDRRAPARRRAASPSSSSSPSSSCRAATRCSWADRSPPTSSRCSAGRTIRRSRRRTSSPCCVSEGLHDLNALVVENPHAAALHVPLPDEAEMLDVRAARCRRREFPTLADEVGSAGRHARRAADRPQPRRRAHRDRARAAERQAASPPRGSARIKKEMIERECQGLLEFIESPFTLDHVAGLDAGQGVAARGRDAAAARRAARAADGLSHRRPHRHRQDVPRPVLGRRARHPVRRVQELPRPLGRRDRVEPREDLRRAARARPGRGVRGRSRSGGGQARSRRRRQRPVRPRLLDAGQGDVRHAQPRPHHLGLRHVAARPARSRPEAAGPARRPHPAVSAGDRRGAARAAAGHRAQAEVPAHRSGPAAARRRRRAGRPRARGRAGPRAADP